jgi:hypothetical protein
MVGMIAYSRLLGMRTLFQEGYNGKMSFHRIVDVAAMLVVFIVIFQVIANWLYKRFNE